MMLAVRKGRSMYIHLREDRTCQLELEAKSSKRGVNRYIYCE